MVRFDLFVTAQQREDVRRLSERTGLTAAELMRRMIDHGTQEQTLNALVPNYSGQLTLRSQS